jgi:hypothetical protein
METWAGQSHSSLSDLTAGEIWQNHSSLPDDSLQEESRQVAWAANMTVLHAEFFKIALQD